jgi:hypothetical protein
MGFKHQNQSLGFGGSGRTPVPDIGHRSQHEAYMDAVSQKMGIQGSSTCLKTEGPTGTERQAAGALTNMQQQLSFVQKRKYTYHHSTKTPCDI